MPEYVRVKDRETHHHHSIHKAQYERNKEAWDVLKQDATYSDGTPLPPKFKTSVDQKATENKGGRTAENKEK